jgi:FixJ family two-component response regulator
MSQYLAVVDDDASVREALAVLLRACGFASRTFASAGEFLAALPSGTPDCLITDLEMPEMSGLDLQRELSRRGIRIRTVVITGRDSDSYRDQCGALGAAAYLVKPVGCDALIAAIS